jgi:glycerophosphoryl diester phosphodiesterase
MTMSVLDIAMGVADAVTAVIPRRAPQTSALERCRIISHRGEHDGRNTLENTLAAFRCAGDAGVWGIECDIRFTADGVPVICHDPDLGRVFGLRARVAELALASLQRQCPEVPTLEAVVSQLGGQVHLMLEVKAEAWPRQRQQSETLRAILSGLDPVEDYHLLSLEPELFARLAFAPPACMLPVAETNVRRMSALALEKGYAGLGGHYLLLGERLRRRHAAAGQCLGTGFPTSANGLRREVNRGIDWVFSNHAVKLERLRREMLARSVEVPPQA